MYTRTVTYPSRTKNKKQVSLYVTDQGSIPRLHASDEGTGRNAVIDIGLLIKFAAVEVTYLPLYMVWQ
jgi:hypothetical protein